jgi:hypothetical protein
MAFYLGLHPDSSIKTGTVWDIDPTTAKAIGRAQIEGVLSVTPTITIENHPGWRFMPLKLAPGHYYPRMARPNSARPFDALGYSQDSDRSIMASSSGQLHALIESMTRICRVVEPDERLTFNSFGHEIRNLIILACTEVEDQCKGILEAHQHQKLRNIEDYWALNKAMNLDEFGVSFPYYPRLRTIKPFEAWKGSTSYVPLKWYQAYNEVKHNRRKQFALANLGNAFQAITGLFVLMCAQYGWRFALPPEQASRAFFHLGEMPIWNSSEAYTPDNLGQFTTEQTYQF